MTSRAPLVVRAPAAVAGALALSLLVGCAAAPAPRTQSNAVEREALARAGNYFGAVDAPVQWVQLWTTSQAGPVIQKCVDHLSDGVVDAAVLVDSHGGLGVTLSFRLGGASAEDLSRFIARSAVQDVVDRCIASTPIDDRVSRIPRRDWDALYSYDVTVLRRCLISHGQQVSRPPAREPFENLLNAGAPWSPYDRVVVKDRAAWFALADACPAIPSQLAVD